MISVDWDRLRSVFAAARELPESARPEFLDAAASDDPALRREVESLLAHDDDEDDDEDSDDALAPPPPTIAGFRILDRIGRGGMGVVYRAEQDHPRRVVALKVLSQPVGTPRALRRFEYEAELLGRLQHPGIAQVFAAGCADTNAGAQPYLAMELVDGEPLDEFAHRLDRRGRCELLARLADAVHHAHQNGVIHCDLKPGNVLVLATGQPKVLDFGIARAVDQDRVATTLRSCKLRIAGTLAYMSPEQAAGDVRTLDVRTDVYALGVIAYEVFSGRLPLDLRDKELLAALAAIRLDEPQSLATRDRSLRGDLTTIVHRALAKERERRYASASEFAADLRSYLQDRPIAARPPSTVYSLRKFAKRHAVLVAAASVATFALLAGTVATAIGLQHAVRSEARATRDRDFLRDRILSIDPDRAGGEVRLVDVVEQAADALDQSGDDDPTGRAEMQLVLASTLRSLGSYPRATELSRSAWSTLQEQRGPTDPATLDARTAHAMGLACLGRRTEAAAEFEAVLARADDLPAATRIAARAGHASVLADLGHDASAETEFAIVAEDAATELGLDSVEHLSSQASLADLRVRRGAADEGTAGLRRALAAVEARHGADHPAGLRLRYSLTTSLAMAGQSEAAQHELEDLLPRQVRVLGEAHAATRHTRCSLALACQQQGNLDAANASLAPLEPLIAGRDSSEVGLRARVIFANLRAQSGRFDDAANIARTATEDAARVLGPTAPLALDARSELVHALAWLESSDAGAELDILLAHLHAVADLNDTLLISARIKAGAALMQLGRGADAERFFGDFLAAIPDGEREAGATAIEIRGYLLYLYLSQGRLTEAAELGDTLLPVARSRYGERSPQFLMMLHNQAGVLRRLERFDEALALYRESFAARRELFGDVHSDTRSSRLMYTLALLESGAADAAEGVAQDLLRIEEQLDPNSDMTINARLLLGRVSLLRDDPSAAIASFEATLEQYAAQRPANDPALDLAHNLLAEACLRAGRAEAAEPHAHHYRTALEAAMPGTWEAAAAGALHGRCLLALGLHAEAEAALRAAIPVLESRLGVRHSRTRRAIESLAQLLDATQRGADAEALRTRLD